MPSHILQNSTPLETLFHEQLDYGSLHAFGCACWPNLRPYNNHKLSFRSTQCVFLGYSSIHKGYKCLDRATGRIYISRDVMFDESLFPFATSLTLPSSSTAHEPVACHDQLRNYSVELMTTNMPVEGACVSGFTGASPVPIASSPTPATSPVPTCSRPTSAVVPHDILSSSDVPDATIVAPPPPTLFPALTSSIVAASAPSPVAVPTPAPPTVVAPTLAAPIVAASAPAASTGTAPSSITVSSELALELIPAAAPASTSTIVTRSRNNICKPRVPSDGTIFYDPNHCAFSAVPSSYHVALADDKWWSAMEAGFHALQANNTWTLVPKPPDQNVISCKWVFRVKENSDGSIA
jgi:hypothetical protein